MQASSMSCQYCGTITSGEQAYCCRACELLDSHVHAFAKTDDNPFSHLDTAEFQAPYRHEKKDFDFLFYAEGMHCSSCVHLLEKLPQFCEDVLTARVNYAQSTAAVKLREGASLAQVAFSIRELGYQPTLLSPQDHFSDRYKNENREFLKRIAVAGFCAGNIMLFVVPVYAGLTGLSAVLFNWISFILFLPILFYSAIPFYRGALNSLKYKVINVDLPIAVAMLSGFVLSTYNLIRGDGAIYYDSTASFLFLILSARYLLKRVQQNYLSPSAIKSFFKSEEYTVSIEGRKKVLPWSKIEAGQTLLVRRSQTLPVDGELLSSSALIDMSLFSGESLPKTFSKGMTLFAGTKLLDQEVELRVQKPFTFSRLGLLLKDLDENALKKNDFVALTDRLAQKLIFTVFSVALIFFLIYMNVDFNEAFNRALALIVLACPCALAFGSPLTFGMALKKAQKKGILLKDAGSLERILKIKNVFFDKTGTLTEGALDLSYTEPAVLSEETKRIILSLETLSYHPVAFALRKAWNLTSPDFKVEEHEETLGRGVRGRINGHVYEVRTLSESLHESENGIELIRDSESVCRLYFTDRLRSDSKTVVQSLQARGLQCFLLSGDKKSRVARMAASCDIAKENSYGELFPEDKRALLKQYSDTCMIGDGANDSLSLQAADVGIAVKGSVDLSLQSADIYFTRGGLSPLRDLLSLAERTRHVLYRNLALSLVYNSVGGVLALAGFINPMMAAILMPLSSIAIILSSLWGFR
ncbi:heavy metal translocating P-type ATPase [Bdellovibrio sp. 22V]|uniref:heavy metal translocating P-type ATPase n=1 Tax=Bdellovibrio sp. 22V TaxID=3044166 RepID=UPI002543BD2C|nr:heavy metal translocating P-type ATPase [Bdellovibrio sp. 22V]WII73655.1 heavy metal translocating P-type ATPase [Bdellovibrio sp. 22V]